MKPEKKALELSEDEKQVLNLLKANSPVDLNELKGQTGLSNKKWNKAIKGQPKTKLPGWKKPMQARLFRWYKAQSISKMISVSPNHYGWAFFCPLIVTDDFSHLDKK